MQTIEYKDENGNVQYVQVDISSGLKIVDIPDNEEWTLTTQDSSVTYESDYVGVMPKRT